MGEILQTNNGGKRPHSRDDDDDEVDHHWGQMIDPDSKEKNDEYVYWKEGRHK